MSALSLEVSASRPRPTLVEESAIPEKNLRESVKVQTVDIPIAEVCPQPLAIVDVNVIDEAGVP